MCLLGSNGLSPVAAPHLRFFRQRQPKMHLDLLGEFDAVLVDQFWYGVAVFDELEEMAQFKGAARLDPEIFSQTSAVTPDVHSRFCNVWVFHDALHCGRHEVFEFQARMEARDVKYGDSVTARKLDDRDVVLNSVMGRGRKFPFHVKAQYRFIHKKFGHFFRGSEAVTVMDHDGFPFLGLVQPMAPLLCRIICRLRTRGFLLPWNCSLSRFVRLVSGDVITGANVLDCGKRCPRLRQSAIWPFHARIDRLAVFPGFGRTGK